MYCTSCGVQLEQNTNFCTSCGAKTEQEVSTVEDNQVLFEIKPHFIGPMSILYDIPLYLVVAFFMLFIPFFGKFFWLSPVIGYIGQREFAKRTVYKFYKTRVECHCEFIISSVTTIKYKNITETSLKQGPAQKKHNLGNITLVTAAESCKIMYLYSIQTPDAIYSKIKELIEN